MKKLFLITSVLLIASCTNTGTHSVTVTDSNIVIKKQTDTTIHVIVDTVKEK